MDSAITRMNRNGCAILFMCARIARSSGFGALAGVQGMVGGVDGPGSVSCSARFIAMPEVPSMAA